MLSLPPTVRVFVAVEPFDMRGSFDAMAGAVRRLGLDPVDRHLYLFFNKRRRLAKSLWFDGSGWCLLAKRLEAGSFQLPPCSIVGWEVLEEESAEAAAKLMERTCEALDVDSEGLHLHSDKGGPMKGATMLATLQRLGVVASFSRPRVSDDNPYSEALFRTLKYRPGFPNRPFRDIHEARDWVSSFVHWYNTHHLHSAPNFVTHKIATAAATRRSLRRGIASTNERRSSIRSGGQAQHAIGHQRGVVP